MSVTLNGNLSVRSRNVLRGKIKEDVSKLNSRKDQVDVCFEICKDLIRSFNPECEIARGSTDVILKHMEKITSVSAEFGCQIQAENDLRDSLAGDIPDTFDIVAALKNLKDRDSRTKRDMHNPAASEQMKEWRAELAEENKEEVEEDDGMVVGYEKSTICPITTQEMTKPFKSTVCGHSFEHTAILSMLSQHNQSSYCPVGGCGSRLTAGQLTRDLDLERIIKKKARDAKRAKRKRAVDKDEVNFTQKR